MAIQLTQCLSPNRVICDNKTLSKTAAILTLCKIFSIDNAQLNESTLFDAFINRERLGNTAIGHGVAIPHVRSEHVNTCIASFIKLNNPIDFGALDQKPVDLLVALVVPAQEHQNHLNHLASIAKLFSHEAFRKSLRAAMNDNELYEALKSYEYEPTA